jgi:hypothetical protein
MEHPMISQINRTGYPNEMEEGYSNLINQPEHAGIDYYGTEIIEGDEIAIDQENFGEIILKENLKQYLVENRRFIFKGGIAVDKNRLDVLEEQDLEKYLHEEYNFKFAHKQNRPLLAQRSEGTHKTTYLHSK